MRKLIPIYFILILMILVIAQRVKAENVHFNNFVYTLKSGDISNRKNVVKNDYYRRDKNKDYWTSAIQISYYPEISNPLKYAAEVDKKIEGKENLLLLKFIQNKKQNIAIISYLENIVQNDKTYFIYNLCKYEKHPKKGILELKFSKKYVFNTKEEITQIGKEVKSINNDYMEQMIILHIPAIVEKEF